MESACHLRGQRTQPVSVVGVVARGGKVNADLIELHELRPALDLSASGLGRIRKVEAVDAAVDAIPLAQRSRSRLGDAGLPQVVTHLLERRCRSGHATDRKWKGGHEVHQPWKERPAFEEVVMTLDQ